MTQPRLDNQLCFALYSASNHVTRLYRNALESFNLTYPQFLVLLALWEEDHLTVTALAQKTRLSSATMTPLLKRLEDKSLIIRQTPEHNERQKQIILTEEGRALSEHSKGITEQVFCTTGLTKEEAHQAIAICHKLTGMEAL